MQYLRTLGRRPAQSAVAAAMRAYTNYPKKVTGPPARKFPDLLYFPKFFRWLGMKCKFKYLQKAWDGEFSEGAFIYGSTQAICRITQIVHAARLEQLRGLLTPTAEARLRRDSAKLTATQRHVVGLQPSDIKLLVPVRVLLVRDAANARRVFVLLKSLAMKWYEDERQHLKLVLVVVDAEFTREYAQTAAAAAAGRKSEWFVSLFDIVQCALIGDAPPDGAD